MDPGKPVSITLSYAEVVVLSELLHRWEDDGTLDGLPVEDPAELKAMWALTATMEPIVEEVFSADYAEVLETARRALGDDSGLRGR